MGRIRCSGSPVVRAKTKTTTDRRVRATSDCSTRNRTNRSTELINVGGSGRRGRSTEGSYAPLVLPRPAPPTGARSSAGQLVQEQVVHHGARVPLAERLGGRSEEHTSELQSHVNLVCRLLLEKKKK